VSEIDNLRNAITALQSHQTSLGEANVKAAIEALQARLKELERETTNVRSRGEWKQLTVLFADISGFTALNESMSAEVVRTTINACFERLGGVVARYGGYIDKFIGDEIMVLFGAPIAMEDHVSRALYAALDMQDAVADFNRSRQEVSGPLGLHIGINSGLVVAGTLGTEDRRDYTVIGDPVNIAARLVALAKTGQILVGAATAKLGGQDFELEDRGVMAIEGHSPVNALLVHSARYRLPHRGAVSLKARMMGRDAEMALLEQAFDDLATFRETRGVVVFGAPGIGKSRLLLEFIAWLHDKHSEAMILSGSAFSLMSASPYAPLADLLRQWLSVHPTEAGVAVNKTLALALARIGLHASHVVEALAEILAVEHDGDTFRLLLPEERRERIFAAFKSFCEHLAAASPTVVVLDDMHWADSLSLELIEYLAREVRGPLLLLVLSRSALDPSAAVRQMEIRLEQSGFASIPLKELSRPITLELLEAIAPGISRWSDLGLAIAERSQGNPFFTEAIIAAFMETGELVRGEDGVHVRDNAQVARVPRNIWALLAERIDRLEEAERRVLQSAAVIGRLFWEGLVGVLLDTSAAGSLRLLQEGQFVEFLRFAPFVEDWEWQFRHVLVQDVAYSTLLNDTRRAYHLKVAQWLEAQVAESTDEFVALLAHHYSAAESWEKAADFAEFAGDRASSLFAYGDARHWYQEALAHLEKLEPNTDVNQRSVSIALKLAGASFYTPTMPIFDALIQAIQIARDQDDREAHLKLLAAMASWHFMAGQGAPAVETARKAIGLAMEEGLEHVLSVPYSVLGKAMFLLGDYRQAAPILEKSRQLAESGAEDSLARYHFVPTLGYLGMSYEALGDLERALHLQNECLRLATQRRDPRQIGAARLYLGAQACAQGNLAKASDHLAEALTVVADRGDPVARYCALGFLGYAYCQRDELQQANQLLSEALALAEQIGSTIFVPFLMAFQADLGIRSGEPSRAVEFARRAVQVGQETRQRDGEADGHRMLAWALFFSNSATREEIRGEFEKAAEITLECGAMIHQSRILFELADFLRRTGDETSAAEAEAKARSLASTSGADWLPLGLSVPRSRS
jgi:class 3 adenylate cyclase/tetratricopeptide (TPR) repeat protein